MQHWIWKWKSSYWWTQSQSVPCRKKEPPNTYRRVWELASLWHGRADCCITAKGGQKHNRKLTSFPSLPHFDAELHPGLALDGYSPLGQQQEHNLNACVDLGSTLWKVKSSFLSHLFLDNRGENPTCLSFLQHTSPLQYKGPAKRGVMWEPWQPFPIPISLPQA